MALCLSVSLIGFFSPVILTRNFEQSLNPDDYFWQRQVEITRLLCLVESTQRHQRKMSQTASHFTKFV